MFLASIGETWIAIAEGLEYGWAWLADNFTNALKYMFYIVTSGSFLTGVIYFIKVGLPILKRINNPTLTKLKEMAEDNNITKENTLALVSDIKELKEENATLREYVGLASEYNSRNVMLTKEMQEKFGYLSNGLKETKNEIAVNVANKIDESTEDEVLTTEEVVEIANEIPEVEETLGMSVDEIELELKGN